MNLWPPQALCPTSATPPTRCLLLTQWTEFLLEGEGQHFVLLVMIMDNSDAAAAVAADNSACGGGGGGSDINNFTNTNKQ